jgi:hypothetical protein
MPIPISGLSGNRRNPFDQSLCATDSATFRDVSTGYLTLTPTLFAALPSPATEGMVAWVTDGSTATWGATLAGGGANKVLAVYDGTNWTVAGK